MVEALVGTMLVAGLVFPGVAAYTAVYVTLGAMLLLFMRTPAEVWCSPVVMALGIGAVALVLSILLNGAGADHWVALAMILPFLGCVSAGGALRSVSPLYFGSLCLIGVFVAFGVGVVDVLVLGLGRAGGDNNPIHYASLAVMLGFVALVGAVDSKSRSRFIFLLGPMAACAAALLSGSRGPLLAACMLMVVALFVFRRDRAFFVGLLALPALAGIALLASEQGARALSLFAGILDGSTVNNNSLRFTMLQTAWELFMQSPLWGHGLGNMMPLARDIAPELTFDNLHSDIANFIALGGLLGLVTYTALILAPLLALARRENRVDPVMVFLALTICAGNLVLGLTNSIIGVLPQMTLYVLMLGYLVALERSAAAKAENGVSRL